MKQRWLIALAVVVVSSPALAQPFSLNDSLRGSTVGNPVGGSLGPDGWTVTANTDRLWYAIPTLVTGSIEFTVTNMSNANLELPDNELFAMYEAGFGISEPITYSPDFRNNHYKCMLRIYGQQEPGRPGLQKLMWGVCNQGAPGYDACSCPTSFFEEPFGGDGSWSGSAERLRIEWGNGTTRYLRNGTEIVSIDWSAAGVEFGPSELHFSLGSSRPSAVGTAGMPIGAVFSDLVVSGSEGPHVTCSGAGGAAGAAGSASAGGAAGATNMGGSAGSGSGGTAAWGGAPSGGGNAWPDAGAGAAGPARGSTSDEEGSCGCRSAGSRTPASAGWLLVTGLAALHLRRWRRSAVARRRAAGEPARRQLPIVEARRLALPASRVTCA